MKSYKLFILFILFVVQLVGCAPSTILAIPTSIADRRTTETQILDNKIFLSAWNPIQEIIATEEQKSRFNHVVFRGESCYPVTPRAGKCNKHQIDS